VADDLPDLQLAKNTGRFVASPRVSGCRKQREELVHT